MMNNKTDETHDTAPVVYILMPIKNGVEYLENSLKSVLRQTYKKWVLVIGINGDKTVLKTALECLLRFREEYDTTNIRIKWYDTIGKPNTLNAMVNDIPNKIEWVAILDVDDVWDTPKLETQVNVINLFGFENIDVIGTMCQYFGDSVGRPKIPQGADVNTHNFFAANPIINSSALLKKRDAVWRNEHPGLEDYDLWLSLRIEKKRTFYNIPMILVYHRIHKTSAFNNSNSQNVPALLDEWKRNMKKTIPQNCEIILGLGMCLWLAD